MKEIENIQGERVEIDVKASKRNTPKKFDFFKQVEIFKRGMLRHIRMPDPKTGKLLYFTKKQIQFIELALSGEVLNLGYGGAARGGKTWIFCCFFLLMSFAYPETRYGVGRKELNNLKQTTITTFLYLCHKCGINEVKKGANNSDFTYTINNSNHVITFGNGSQVLFVKTKLEPKDLQDDLARFGSLELTMIAIDEANETDKLVIETFGTRAGNWLNKEYGLPALTIEVFNPSQGHVRNRYWLPYKKNAEIPIRRFVRALPTDNPSPEVKDYVETQTKKYRAGELSKVQYERLILGNFDYDDDPAKIFDDLAIDQMYENTVVLMLNDFTTPHLICDVAFRGSDKFVCSYWEGNILKKWYVLEKTNGSQVLAKIIELQKKHSVANIDVVFDASGTGQGLTGYYPKRCDYYGNATAKENKRYGNQRAEDYFNAANAVNLAEWHIQDTEYMETVKLELKSIKDKAPDTDSKRYIISKEKIKESLGNSPDFADNFQMKAYYNKLKFHAKKIIRRW